MWKLGKIILVFIGVLSIVLPILFAAYIGYQTVRGVYAYSKNQDSFFYANGCPYTLGAVTCRWTDDGYSGFRIGMSKAEMLAILCSGNEYGNYTPPLDADKKPDFEVDSRISFWEPETFTEFPCRESNKLDDFIRFTFERDASAWELELHREIFGLIFRNNKLVLIQVHRSLIYIDL